MTNSPIAPRIAALATSLTAAIVLAGHATSAVPLIQRDDLAPVPTSPLDLLPSSSSTTAAVAAPIAISTDAVASMDNFNLAVVPSTTAATPTADATPTASLSPGVIFAMEEGVTLADYTATTDATASSVAAFVAPTNLQQAIMVAPTTTTTAPAQVTTVEPLGDEFMAAEGVNAQVAAEKALYAKRNYIKRQQWAKRALSSIALSDSSDSISLNFGTTSTSKPSSASASSAKATTTAAPNIQGEGAMGGSFQVTTKHGSVETLLATGGTNGTVSFSTLGNTGTDGSLHYSTIALDASGSAITGSQAAVISSLVASLQSSGANATATATASASATAMATSTRSSSVSDTSSATDQYTAMGSASPAASSTVTAATTTVTASFDVASLISAIEASIEGGQTTTSATATKARNAMAADASVKPSASSAPTSQETVVIDGVTYVQETILIPVGAAMAGNTTSTSSAPSLNGTTIVNLTPEASTTLSSSAKATATSAPLSSSFASSSSTSTAAHHSARPVEKRGTSDTIVPPLLQSSVTSTKKTSTSAKTTSTSAKTTSTAASCTCGGSRSTTTKTASTAKSSTSTNVKLPSTSSTSTTAKSTSTSTIKTTTTTTSTKASSTTSTTAKASSSSSTSAATATSTAPPTAQAAYNTFWSNLNDLIEESQDKSSDTSSMTNVWSILNSAFGFSKRSEMLEGEEWGAEVTRREVGGVRNWFSKDA